MLLSKFFYIFENIYWIFYVLYIILGVGNIVINKMLKIVVFMEFMLSRERETIMR